MTKKLTYEYVKNYIESFECKLISTKYENCISLLELEDVYGHSYLTTFNRFRADAQHYCPKCGKERQAKSLLLSYSYVEKYVEDNGNGDRLVPNSFVGTDKKMLIECSRCHKKYKTFWNGFLAGNRCKKCSMEKLWDKSRNSKKDIIELIENAGYILIEDFEYRNNLTKICIQDKDGYKYDISVNGFQVMFGNNQGLNKFHTGNKYTIENINLWLRKEKRECSIISKEYSGSKHKNLIAKCDSFGHLYNTSLGILCNCKYSGCLICASAMTESKIASYLKEYCNDYFGNDAIPEYKLIKNPKTGRFLRNDIYIQSLSLHIEIMGTQHYIKNNKFYKSNDDFLYQQYRDDIKRKEIERLGHNYLEIDLRKIKTLEESKYLLIDYISKILGISGEEVKFDK